MSAVEPQAERRLTGGHVAAMFVGGFGIIIAVNLTLAFNAVRTFPGVETDNVYVTSQMFDATRAAQDALGWEVRMDHDGENLLLSVTEEDGRPVQPEIVSATLGRATTVADDRTPAFAWDGRALIAPAVLADGNWNLRLHLRAPDGTAFRRRIPFVVAP